MERKKEKMEKDVVGDEEFFCGSQFCVYIGHRWRYRKNKNSQGTVLSTDHSQTFGDLGLVRWIKAPQVQRKSVITSLWAVEAE